MDDELMDGWMDDKKMNRMDMDSILFQIVTVFTISLR